ncbi:unnamed protein product [Mesocestoides corti]|uniref:RING-type E3 ubiquitin transferase n=2 Tax=Mesocestoides corti TaxID=53468 RepID=A0A158QV53_MESCO|nr:unnamed protein product [Mesocestoides corti]
MDDTAVPSTSSSNSTQRRGKSSNDRNDPDPSDSQPPPVPPPPSASSSSGTNGNFECNICLDQAQDAVVSPCGHLFCWPCLHQWIEVKRSQPVCPVCKSVISRESVIPLYGRGADHKNDPRSKIPPRPQGRRTEPEPQRESPFSAFSNFFGGNTGAARDDGGGDGNFHVSFGIGPFPFGLFTTSFNVGGGRGTGDGLNNNQAGGVNDAEALSKVFFAIAMVRVKYRYIVSIVSIGSTSGGVCQGVANRPGYPGCPPLCVTAPSSSTASDDTLIYRAIKRSMQTAHGTIGVGRMMSRFRIIYWNPFSGLLIIRVLRGLATEQMTSALSLITVVQDGPIERPAVVDVVHRSGTVRCCQKFIVDYYKTQLSGCISGVTETAIARAVARKLIDTKPPDLNLDLN